MSAATLSPEKSGAKLWPFPGASQQRSYRIEIAAVMAALLLHAGLGLVRTEGTGKVSKEVAIALEAFSVEEPAPVEPEPTPVETEAQPEVPVDVPVERDAQPSASAPSDDLVDVSVEDGAPTEELAAPLATSDFGAEDFAMLSGHGTALGRGGLGRPGRGAGGQGTSSKLTARDLSREAIAPNLVPLVKRNFPVAARLARVDGNVTVSAVIQPDGNPTDVRVISVSPRGRGFGESCSRTVHQGPDWQPKLNRDGRPVAAKVRYTCRFKLPESSVTTDKPSTGAGANRVWTKPAGG